MSNLVWEEEFFFLDNPTRFDHSRYPVHHLKKVIIGEPAKQRYKISVANVQKVGKRQFKAEVTMTNADEMPTQTCRSLAEAKAWCLAIYTLEK